MVLIQAQYKYIFLTVYKNGDSWFYFVLVYGNDEYEIISKRTLSDTFLLLVKTKRGVL